MSERRFSKKKNQENVEFGHLNPQNPQHPQNPQNSQNSQNPQNHKKHKSLVHKVSNSPACKGKARLPHRININWSLQ